MMNHMMVDLETLGTGTDTVVVSAGIVMFDPEAGAVHNMHQRHWSLNIQDQLDHDRTVTGATIKWWLKQSDEAIRSWNNAEATCAFMQEFEMQFTDFWDDWGAKYIWSHGSVFDVMILESMFGGRQPWKFYDIRDTRTLLHVSQEKINRASGTHHNALDDAIAQAHGINEAWAVCNGER